MQDFERNTVVDIARRRESGGGSRTSKLPPPDPEKTAGIRAKVRSFAKKLLGRKENEISDQILGDD